MDYAERILREQLEEELDALAFANGTNDKKYIVVCERRIKSIKDALEILKQKTDTYGKL